MLCVMIAAEQPRLSIQSQNTTQNNQKILKSKQQQQQQLAKEDIGNIHHQQQQHHQNHHHHHQNINSEPVGVEAASVATTTPILNTEKNDETRSEKKVPTTGHLSDALKVQSGSSKLKMVTSATDVGLCDGNRLATTITTTTTIGANTTRKTINCLPTPVTLQLQPPQVQMQPLSTKIQQKQQRFLAAAAKSATSLPDCATAAAPAATASAHTAAVVITGTNSKRPSPQTTVSDAEAEVAATATAEALAAAVVPAVEAAEEVASATPTTLSPPIDQQHQTYQVQSLKQTPSAPQLACCKAAPATISHQHSLQQNHNLHNQHHHHHHHHQQQQQHLHNNHHQPQQQHHHHLQQYHHHLHHQHPSQLHHNHSIIINNNATSNQQPSLQRQSFLNFNNHHNHHHQQHYQYQQPQQQQAMAHYKFHNDCQSSVLTYEQVKRLDLVMDQTVPIHGRGNFPTLYVKLKELIRLVKYKLQKEHSIEIRDVRLNGGAASYVLAPENSHYNDLDLIFGTDLSNEDQFDVIRDVVLECLKEFYPNEKAHEPFVVDKQLSSTANDSASDGSLVNIAGTKGATDNSNNSGCNSLSRTINCDPERPKTPEMDKGSDKNSEPSSLEQHQQLTEMNKSVLSEGEKLNRSNTEKKALKGNGSSKSFEPDRDDINLQQLSNHVQYQQQSYQMPLNSCAIKEAYVHKMVKVNDDDRWSLISLGVQQSEANCCSQSICPSSSTIATSATQRNNQCCMDSKQQLQYRQFSGTNNLAADRESNGSTVNHTNAQMISNENHVAQANFVSGQHNQQLSYVQHQTNRNHYQLHQKQFPNSIELKFVDKMRRKFEFSVDSFQIILDSLIQFYDYAPQSTIASQKILINSHPSSTMINTRPLINKRRSNTCNSNECKSNDRSSVNLNEATKVKREGYESSNNQRVINGFSGAKTCESLSSTQSYYQLPIEPANSPSISSVASSSGCSSSSSVVSSSSSSLSCDEDHEDLYCEVDGPSSSSASTSSLLSSTNLSLLSSDGISSATELTPNRDSDQVEDSNSKQAVKRNERVNGTASTGCSTNLKTTINKMNSNLSAVDPSLDSLNGGPFECAACLGQEESLVNNMYDFETKSKTSCAVISENFYPTVIGRSEYGNFKEALYHLEKKLIATRSPEEIRGGGLLKYCNLLVKNYKPTNVYQIRTLERYMCSRFFIDFSDLNQQQAKLESYLANHFSDDPLLKFDYLTVLHNVVQRSTVCLMNHELRLTLNMIRDLAYKLNEQQEQQNQQQMQHNHNQPQQQQQQQQHHQVQQPNLNQPQQHYYQHKPVLIQSGIYRVKLVNYTLAKPAGS